MDFLYTPIAVFVPSKFCFVLFCLFLSKAKPNTLHFGEMKVCRCILYQTQNQETNDTAQGEKLFGDPVAVQSLAAMVQATGFRLSPERNKQQQREKIKKKK